DRPMDELAAAVGANSSELPRAIHAERAFEGTDSGVGRTGCQVPIAALAAGSELEHLRVLFGKRGRQTYRERALIFGAGTPASRPVPSNILRNRGSRRKRSTNGTTGKSASACDFSSQVPRIRLKNPTSSPPPARASAISAAQASDSSPDGRVPPTSSFGRTMPAILADQILRLLLAAAACALSGGNAISQEE